MYMILLWEDDDSYLTCIHNENGSIRLFTLTEADEYANNNPRSDDMRVISIEV